MCFESSVSVSDFWCLNDLVWFLYLLLKFLPVLPIYVLVWLSYVTVAL